VMTAATPMTMPRMVRKERILLRRMALKPEGRHSRSCVSPRCRGCRTL
jgi:hypothetical protein